METNIKRPPSVWITQVLLLFLALVFMFLLFSVVLMPFHGSVISFLILFSILCGIIIFLLAGFWGLLKRQIYGRWLSFAALCLLLVMMIVSHIVHPPGPMKYYEYSNATQWAYGQAITVVIWILFALFIYRLGFGPAANAFFAKPDTAE